MWSIDVSIEGDIAYCVQDEDINKTAKRFTSSYDGVVEVGVFLGNYESQKFTKTIVLCEDVLTFVWIDRFFFIMIEEKFINEEEMQNFTERSVTPLSLEEFISYVN